MIMKPTMLICAPVSSRSGYGEHARDLFYAFDKLNRYEIKIIDVRWGECPRNALNKDNPIHKKMLDSMVIPQTINQWLANRPLEYYVDIRIPNEFNQWGKVNIGITAGVETTAVSQAWLDGCNKMDLIIVPSEHSKSGFVNSIWDKMQQLPDGKQQKVGTFQLEKPIEVLFEGADEDIYKPLKTVDIPDDFYKWFNDTVKENFAYLFVGQWCKGNYGQDRKDIGRTIKLFFETFANKKNQPALVLKTSGAGFSVMDKEDCIRKIKTIKSMFPSDIKLPPVYLLHGDLKPEEMNYLYNHPKVKCMVNLTHGEGFGRPMLEATMTGLPVMASGWSGQLDFLDKDLSILIGGDMVRVPKSVVWKDIIIEESEWFNTNEGSVVSAYKHINTKHLDVKKKAKKLMTRNRKKFTLDGMCDSLGKIMDNVKPSVQGSQPQQVGLKLPKLKKKGETEKTELPKINLPKLKKVNKKEEAADVRL